MRRASLHLSRVRHGWWPGIVTGRFGLGLATASVFQLASTSLLVQLSLLSSTSCSLFCLFCFPSFFPISPSSCAAYTPSFPQAVPCTSPARGPLRRPRRDFFDPSDPLISLRSADPSSRKSLVRTEASCALAIRTYLSRMGSTILPHGTSRFGNQARRHHRARQGVSRSHPIVHRLDAPILRSPPPALGFFCLTRSYLA